MSAQGKPIRSPIQAAKHEFRFAATTLFKMPETAADALWAQLRSEVTVEEIQDVSRPLHRLARRVAQARRDGRRWRS